MELDKDSKIIKTRFRRSKNSNMQRFQGFKVSKNQNGVTDRAEQKAQTNTINDWDNQCGILGHSVTLCGIPGKD